MRKPAVVQLLAATLAAAIVVVTSGAAASAQSSNEPLASADAAMQAGRFDEAARAYEAWLGAHHDAKEVMLALGVCYVQLGRNVDAVPVLQRYVRLDPSSAAGHAALGVALLDSTSTSDAEVELKTALKLDPKQADAADTLARVYLASGRAAEAVAVVRPIAGPEAADDRQTLLADAMIAAGQAREAGEMLERRLDANPRCAASVYRSAARAYLTAGDLARTADLCERGMRLYPDSAIESVYLALPAPLLAERVGARIRQMQDAPDAAELIALGRVMTDADPNQKTRANEIAQRLLAHAVALAPANPSAYYNYGRALAQHDPPGALAQWEKALSLGPDDALRCMILTKIASARSEASDADGADRAFREAVDISRRALEAGPEASLAYARFLQTMSRNTEAEALVQDVLRRNPLSPQANVERGKLLAARGRWSDVVETGEFVLRNAGGDEELLRSAHVLLARAYLFLKQPEKAAAHRAWLDAH